MKPISDRIKSVLQLNGKKNVDLAAYLGMSPQSLQNKLSRGSFSADDLIRIAEFTGAELAFLMGPDKITLGADCLRDNDSQEE